MLGLEECNEQKIIEIVDMTKYQVDVQDIEFALEALSYLIMHYAKTDFQGQDDKFDAIYDESGLKPEFRDTLFNQLKTGLSEMREIIIAENERGKVSFKDLNWRLSMVSACRQRQRMMFPKYTVKLDLENKPMESTKKPDTETMVFDLDYTSMKHL